MHSLRHALSAAALAALAVTSLTACDKDDIAAWQAAHGGTKPVPTTTAAAPPTTVLPTTSPTTAPTTSPTTAPATATTTIAPTTSATPTSSTAPTTTTRPTTPPPTSTTVTLPPPPTDNSEAGQVLALVNAERAKAGCRPVTLEARLTQAAVGHSQDMAAKNYFSHTSQDGRTFVDRIKATGYTKPRSENIAAGQPTPAAVMDAWMNSDGHKRNILDCSATQMGLGTAKGGSYRIYWTQDFGTG